MTRQDKRAEIVRLQAVVDAFGSDPARWPAMDREALQALASRDGEAAAIVAEAAALERVLDQAPALSVVQAERLAQRIVAAAQAEGRWSGETRQAGTIVVHGRTGDGALADAPRSRAGGAAGGAVAAGVLMHGARRGPLASAGMLAASLVLGMLAGLNFASSDLLGGGVANMAEMGDEGALQQVVMGEDSLDSILEDLL